MNFILSNINQINLFTISLNNKMFNNTPDLSRRNDVFSACDSFIYNQVSIDSIQNVNVSIRIVIFFFCHPFLDEVNELDVVYIYIFVLMNFYRSSNTPHGGHFYTLNDTKEKKNYADNVM